MVAEKAKPNENEKAKNTEVKQETISDAKTNESSENDKKDDSSGEQKAAVTTGSKEENGEPAKTSEDATLILSAEEEAEIAAQTNEDGTKDDSTKSATAAAKSTKKKEPSKNVWVSNISRGTKAADLKKLFSEHFKVESAKIVTNGKSFFGYICLESSEMAQKSVNDLNGTTLSGKKITVSLVRPDLKASKSSSTDAKRKDSKKDPKKESRDGAKKSDETEADKNEEKKDGDAAEGAKDAKESTEEKKKDPEDEKLRQRRKEQRTNRLIQDLRTDLKRVTTELQNNRRRLTEANRRLEAERERKVSMRREIENLEGQLKSERRRFAHDLEQMEKKMKMDQIRYQDDRAVLNKELDECRKLREYLQRKLDDLGLASRHGRSPPHRSGPGGRGMSDRNSDKIPRSRMHPGDNRGRSPPPPPKIDTRSRDRSPLPFKGKKPRMDEPSSKSYGNSHYQGQSSQFSGGVKPLMGHYSQSSSSGGPSREAMFQTTAYPDTHRYGSSYSQSGGYSMGNPTPLMSRPMSYPDVRGQRKY